MNPNSKFWTIAAVVCLMLLATAPAAFAQTPPVNDECSGAITVSALPFSISQNTRLATPNAADPVFDCAEGPDGKTVWFTYTADRDTFVRFSTVGSSPSDYDIVMELFTGSCGSLTPVACNDDITSGTNRASEIPSWHVVNGQTYYILIGEWKGGGPSGGVPTGGDLVFTVAFTQEVPAVKGPKMGMIASGAYRDTSNGYAAPSVGPKPRLVPEHEAQELYPLPANATKPIGAKGSNYIEDRTVSSTPVTIQPPHAMLDFPGSGGSGTPPDPVLGVGPEHVISMVNSEARIYDKTGTLIKSIDLDRWYSTSGTCDPQIFYDHYRRQWVMGAINCALTPNIVYLSVSRDSNPLNPWYNYAFPGNALGDSLLTGGVFLDHPQIGYDSEAVYVTGRAFTSSFLYTTVTVLNKSQLYANTGGPVSYATFWDFRDPVVPTFPIDNIKPSIMFDNAGVQFLVNSSPYAIGTFVTVWTVHNPVASPTVTGANVPTVIYSPPPVPRQPYELPFEANGVMQHKAIYRDSSLWMVHSAGYGPIDPATGRETYSGVHYLRVNPFTNTDQEDFILGLNEHYSFYPSIMVEPNKDVVIGFTRSSQREFAGVYFTGRRHNDPAGLSPSFPLAEGNNSYYIGTRNRWGDYSGMAQDPSDPNVVWSHNEYVVGKNSHGTRVGKLTLAPDPQQHIMIDHSFRDFGQHEIGSIASTDTEWIAFSNVGSSPLTVSSISHADSNYELIDAPAAPFVMGSMETITIGVRFVPKARGTNDTLKFNTDDPVRPVTKFTLKGLAYSVTPAQKGVLYAVSGNIGRVYSVNPATGQATEIGLSGYEKIQSARISPTTGELMGFVGPGSLVRVSSSLGDAHLYTYMAGTPLSMKGMVYKGDTLLFGQAAGGIYRLNEMDSLVQTASTGLIIAGMDFNPISHDLWLSVRSGVVDGIYKMHYPSGPVVLVGRTGFGTVTQDIIFDGAGNLYGVTGSGSSVNNFIRIDTTTGAGTLIGSMGVPLIQGLAWVPDTLAGIASFGIVTTDTTKTITLNFTNPGPDSVSILSVSNPDPTSFSVSAGPAILPPGAGMDYDVTFHPQTAGKKDMQIKFVLNDARRDAIVAVQGFAIRHGAVTANYDARWNMVSVPVLADDFRKSVLFGDAISAAYRYSASYATAETLANGVGYWLKFAGATPVGFPGNFTLSDTIPVTAQWNLIGALSHPIAPSAVVGSHTGTLSPFFGYSGGYQVADSIRPGYGYWVRTDSAGKLILSNAGGPGNGKLNPVIAAQGALNVLHISDAAGMRQDLYFGRQENGMPSVSLYELPPPPPAGIFDARFRTGRCLEYLDPTRTQTLPINLTSADYPVTVSWEMRVPATGYWLKAGSMEIPLVGQGTQTLEHADAMLALATSTKEMVPVAFALHQNFPNPFNPTTRIQYDVPAAVNVSLKVYDVLGRLVATLVDEQQSAGYKTVEWNAVDVPSGVYFYRIQAGAFSDAKKLLLLR